MKPRRTPKAEQVEEVQLRPAPPAPELVAALALLYGGNWRTPMGAWVAQVRNGEVLCRAWGDASCRFRLWSKDEIGATCAPLREDAKTIVSWGVLAAAAGTLHTGSEDALRRLSPLTSQDTQHALAAHRLEGLRKRAQLEHEMIGQKVPDPWIGRARGEMTKQGVTSDRLAELLHLGRHEVDRYLRGAEAPPLSFLRALAVVLGIDGTWLVFGGTNT